ncbi:MAG: aldehyde dehydrogenase family protein [Actinobacteria bacterium]|nr:aldehyde dehydrogenase family protein [Actinomycetota bacterium]
MTAATAGLRPMFIGGSPAQAASGASREAVNPATGEVLALLPEAGRDDVDRAVQAAQEAFVGWRRVPANERAAAILALADRIMEHAEELAVLDVLDNGSPIAEMRNDARLAAALMRYIAGAAMLVRGHTVPTMPGRLNYSLHQPFGVVGKIVPFNHPLLFAARGIAAPLVTGNTLVLKPSEHTSLSALRLAELAADLFPPGVLNVITGDGAVAGDAIVRHPVIRRIHFTGSDLTGRRILLAANAERLATVTLELGGKNPLVIFPDADVDVAVEAAVRGMNFTWQGQSCGSTSRLLVHRDLYPAVIERLGSALGSLRAGPPLEQDTQTGAIVNAAQLAKVEQYIKIGLDEGAQLVTGGRRLTEGAFGAGLFVPSTLFSEVTPGSRLEQEEIFGPVLAAMPFGSYEEAVQIANGVPYGLTASVFTGDLGIAHRFAADVEAGYVWVNEVSRHILGVPFGGVKNSGLGREEDLEELYSYTETKNVHVNFDD